MHGSGSSPCISGAGSPGTATLSVAAGDRAAGAGGVGGLIFELLPELLPGEGLTGWPRAAGWGGQGKGPRIGCRSRGWTERRHLHVLPRPRAGKAQLGELDRWPPFTAARLWPPPGRVALGQAESPEGAGGSLEGPCPVAVACPPAGWLVGAPLPPERLMARSCWEILFLSAGLQTGKPEFS